MLYSAVAVKNHKSASVALLGRSLRYKLLRQIVEEVLGLQIGFNSIVYNNVIQLLHCFLLLVFCIKYNVYNCTYIIIHKSLGMSRCK